MVMSICTEAVISRAGVVLLWGGRDPVFVGCRLSVVDFYRAKTAAVMVL